MNFKLTPKAKLDLLDICEYTTEKWSEDQAELFIRRIEKSIEHLCKHPNIGQPKDYLSKNLRSFNAEYHIVYYENEENILLVVRILHQQADAIQKFKR